MSGFDLKDYVDVAERIQDFYRKYPEGSIQTEIVELTDQRVAVKAYAYRSADDPRPGTGHSWLGIPGMTPYTKHSELENAETSAVGRAIAMLGFAVKGGIASRQEIQNKQGQPERATPAQDAPRRPEPAGEAFADGKVAKGRAPVDMSLRETPDGWAFGFVIEEQVEGKQYPRKTQVLAMDDLAHVMASAWDNPPHASVWGELVMVPWDKDGKAMPPFRRIVATRVVTPEWTLPAADAAPAPAPADKPDDLDGLPW